MTDKSRAQKNYANVKTKLKYLEQKYLAAVTKFHQHDSALGVFIF